MGNKVIIQFLSGVSSGLISLMIVSLSARSFGPENLGKVAYLIGLISLIFAFTDLGLSRAHVHFTAASKDKLPALSSFLSLKLPLILLAAAVTLVVGFIKRDFSGAFIAVLLMEIFSRLADSVLIGYEGQERVWPQNLLKNGVKILRLVSVIYFGWVMANALGYALTLTVEATALFAVSLYLTRHWWRRRPEKETVKKYITYSLPFALIMPLSYLQDSGIVLILERFAGAKELGIYAASFGLFGFLKNFTTNLMVFFFPRVSRLYEQKDWQSIQNHLNLATKLSVWFLVPLLTGLFVFRELILRLTLGLEFTEAGSVFSWLLLGVFVLALFAPYDHALFATEKHQSLVKINLLSAALTLFLGWWLVPLWGASGAVIALVCSWSASGLLQLLSLVKKTPLKYCYDWRISRVEVKYLYGLVHSFSQALIRTSRKEIGQ